MKNKEIFVLGNDGKETVDIFCQRPADGVMDRLFDLSSIGFRNAYIVHREWLIS